MSIPVERLMSGRLRLEPGSSRAMPGIRVVVRRILTFSAILAFLLLQVGSGLVLPAVASAESSDSTPQPPPPPLRLRTALTERLGSGQSVHLNMVVILVDFHDMVADREIHTIAHYDSLLFSHGVHPTGSMADYYEENSGGRLRLDGKVVGWYRMPRLYTNYASGLRGLGGYPFNSQGLVEDAVRAADLSVNYALFDNDGGDGVADTFDDDQMVDLLMVIHAGSGGEGGGSPNSLQSIAFALPDPTPFDGVFANEFALTPEDANLGVYAHETGHLFGLPDLYDRTGGSFGLGAWSLMAGGWSLNEARTPANLDAWCKAALGFCSVTNVQGTLNDVAIDPIETGGGVYRLSAGGLPGPEYFLVENRRKVGFDRYLPGEGLLIYHVNELRSTNNVPLQYKVALEQADGLFQLENLGNGASFGDEGDPWTPTSPSGGFGRFTTPNSRTASGLETGVTVYHVAGPDATGRMRADFRVTAGPTVLIDGLDLPPVEGDGDGFVEAGETFEIRPRVNIAVGTAHDVRLHLTSLDPLAELLESDVALGDLAPGDHVAAGAFRVRVAGGVPRNPYGLDFRLGVSYRDEVPLNRPLTVAIGDSVGLADAFESGANGWTHTAVRLGYIDYWRLEDTGGNSTPTVPGPHAWHCGHPEGGFRGGTDAALTSPLFILPPSAHLRVDHLIEILPDDSNQVVAGAFVEISVNGSDWTVIPPTRGYDRIYFGRDESFRLTPILTGKKPGPLSWETLDFDLSRFSGGARLRFRAFSTTTVYVGKGWWLDNLAIVNSTTPVRLAAFRGRREPAGVRLSWRLAGDDRPVGFDVWRTNADGGEERKLNEALLPGGGAAGDFLDEAPPPGPLVYRLEVVERSGGRTLLGTLPVAADAANAPLPVTVECAPNPTRGPALFALQVPAADHVRLSLFDARGRLVRTLWDDAVFPGQGPVAWDGCDRRGHPVPAGLYFYRLECAAGMQSRKVVVSR